MPLKRQLPHINPWHTTMTSSAHTQYHNVFNRPPPRSMPNCNNPHSSQSGKTTFRLPLPTQPTQRQCITPRRPGEDEQQQQQQQEPTTT